MLAKARSMTEQSVPVAGKALRPLLDLLVPQARVGFPVVALGASAGGLDAFKKFFDAMPEKCGMAFVLIQHLDPKHQSLMVDLLTGHTPMTVLLAADGTKVEYDHVYLIPPGAYLAIEGGILKLSKPVERQIGRAHV